MPGKKIIELKKGVKVTKAEINNALIDNFINLQKVLTNLTSKFEDLSNNISKLLQLFEISAKSFIENYPTTESGVDQEFLKKLDSLLEKNKTISRGILLMEEKIRDRMTEERESQRLTGLTRPRPLPRY